MPKSSATSVPRLGISLVPFGYAFISRYHWPRDFTVNAVTAWVPGIILIAHLADLSVGAAAFTYALGYVVFICLYEVGYLANDTFGLRHDPTPRRRVNIEPTPMFVIVFLAYRLAVLMGASLALDASRSPLFWTVVAVLTATLIAHNMVRATELKFYTFLQLSLLRYAMPVLPVFIADGDPEAMLIVLFTGFLLFSLPRFLTYLDAKGRLDIPERKDRFYHLKVLVAVIPMIILVSALTNEPAPLLCLIWGLVVQFIYLARKWLHRTRRSCTPAP